ARGTVRAAARGLEHDGAALLQHVLLAVVDALAVETDLAAAARATAREPGRRVRRALGHEAHHDRRGRLVVDLHLLPEPAAELAGAARARAHPLVAEEQRAVALGDFHRGRRDVARPRQHGLAVPDGRRPHAAV